MCLASSADRKRKWNPQRDITMHLLEGQNEREWPQPGKVRRQRDCVTHTLQMGKDNGQLLRKSIMQFLTKLTRALTIRPSNCTLERLSQRKENLCSHTNLYTNIHSSFICNNQNLETSQMSLTGWMAKQTMADPSHGTLLSNEKEWTIDTLNNVNESSGELHWVKKANLGLPWWRSG